MLVLTGIRGKRAQCRECLGTHFESLLASQIHQSIEYEVQIIVKLVFVTPRGDLLLASLGLLLCEDLVVGDEE